MIRDKRRSHWINSCHWVSELMAEASVLYSAASHCVRFLLKTETDRSSCQRGRHGAAWYFHELKNSGFTIRWEVSVCWWCCFLDHFRELSGSFFLSRYSCWGCWFCRLFVLCWISCHFHYAQKTLERKDSLTQAQDEIRPHQQASSS